MQMLPFPSIPDWARTVNKRENKIEVLFCHCFYQTSLRKRVQIKSILKTSAFSIKCWDSAKESDRERGASKKRWKRLPISGLNSNTETGKFHDWPCRQEPLIIAQHRKLWSSVTTLYLSCLKQEKLISKCKILTAYFIQLWCMGWTGSVLGL